jgi:hypothetical protein
MSHTESDSIENGCTGNSVLGVQKSAKPNKLVFEKEGAKLEILAAVFLYAISECIVALQFVFDRIGLGNCGCYSALVVV